MFLPLNVADRLKCDLCWTCLITFSITCLISALLHSNSHPTRISVDSIWCKITPASEVHFHTIIANHGCQNELPFANLSISLNKNQYWHFKTWWTWDEALCPCPLPLHLHLPPHPLSLGEGTHVQCHQVMFVF